MEKRLARARFFPLCKALYVERETSRMNSLEKLGKLVSEDLRDSALNRYLDLEGGFCGSAEAKVLHEKLATFTEDQKTIIRQALTQAIDTGIHAVSYTHLTLPTICSV